MAWGAASCAGRRRHGRWQARVRLSRAGQPVGRAWARTSPTRSPRRAPCSRRRTPRWASSSRALCFEGPEDALKLTANTQPAILTVSAAAHAVFAERGAGARLRRRATRWASTRRWWRRARCGCGRRGAGGARARHLHAGGGAGGRGRDERRARARCRRRSGEICAAVAAETGEVVSPANYNAPAQTVIAGARRRRWSAPGAKLKEAGAKRVLPLPVSAPFHCALMEPVKPRLGRVLRAIAWRGAARARWSRNVEARPNADAARIVPLLLEQVTAPVRWIECVEALVRQGVTRVVELGPGQGALAASRSASTRTIEVVNVEDRRVASRRRSPRSAA